MKSVSESCAPRATNVGDYDPFKRAFRKNLSAVASFMREKGDGPSAIFSAPHFIAFVFLCCLCHRFTAVTRRGCVLRSCNCCLQ